MSLLSIPFYNLFPQLCIPHSEIVPVNLSLHNGPWNTSIPLQYYTMLSDSILFRVKIKMSKKSGDYSFIRINIYN